MSLCLRVCNVCMYVCTYVCPYVRMDVCMHVCMHLRKYVSMYACMYVRMSVCLPAGLPLFVLNNYACMYVKQKRIACMHEVFTLSAACLRACLAVCMSLICPFMSTRRSLSKAVRVGDMPSFARLAVHDVFSGLFGTRRRTLKTMSAVIYPILTFYIAA